MNIFVTTATLLLALLLSGCGKPQIHRDSAPDAASSPSHHTAKIPNGDGGYAKTGNPYQVAGRWYYPLSSADGYNETGIASWYGTKFHGNRTANGERYDMHALSAAHTTLPMPTMVRVTNLDNGRSVVVRVNDRGPFVKNRLIDLSYAAAKTLGYDNAGTAPVRVEVLGSSNYPANSARASASSSPAPAVVYTPSATPTTAATKTLTATPGAMYIQLGAFSSHNNARKLQTSLAADYPSIGIYSKNGGYSEIYRVRIGPFNDVQNIENDVISLQQRGYNNAIVVIE